MHRMLAVSLGLLLALATACGGGKGAGETCEPTGDGAAKCESALCLAVDCSGTTRYVCAGDACSQTCDGSQVCVNTLGGPAYCLPSTVCAAPTR